MSFDEDTISILKKPGSAEIELLILVGILFLLAFVIFAWAIFFRKSRKRRHYYDHERLADETLVGLPHRRKRMTKVFRMIFGRRRRRRQPRKINPTLADIGGLPESRAEKRQTMN